MPVRRPNGLHYTERLYLNKEVEALFASRTSFVEYPFRAILHIERTPNAEGAGAKILVSIPKKRLKLAVDRNTMKRRVREAYRLQKQPLLQALEGRGVVVSIGFLYLAGHKSSTAKVFGAVQRILAQIPHYLPALEP